MLTIFAAGCGSGRKKIEITTSSELAEAYFVKGVELVESFRTKEACRYFEKAVAEDPDFALAYLFLATSQPSRKEIYENIGIAEELSRPKEVENQQRPSSGLGLTITLPTAVSPEYLQEATRRVDRVSKGERLWILGVAATFAGKSAEHFECFRELAAAYPYDERARRMLGDYYFGTNQYQLAIQEYVAATDINPQYAVAYNMLGYTLRESGDLAGAERAFLKYIELAPDQPNPYDSYADLLLGMGRHEESIEYYRKALARDSMFAFSRVGIAANLNLLGRHAEAREYLHAASDSGLTFMQRRSLLWGIVISYVDEGDLESALAAAEKTSRFSASSGSTIETVSDMNLVGQVLLEMGRLDEARAKFEEGLRLVEESAIPPDVRTWARALTALRVGCRIALKENNVTAARKSIEEFAASVDTTGNPSLRWLLNHYSGLVALEEGDFARAVSELDQGMANDPATHFLLGRAHEKLGDREKAAECYKKATEANLVNDLGYTLIRRKAAGALRSLSET
ncbi:tetratricopeptide repeat protein [bacterium]|nr:tetratricopeptide repeat protein [bacterium]